MDVIYRAFDGQEFKTMASCEAHENALKAEKWSKRIVALDGDGSRAKLTDPESHLVVYIRKNDIEAYETYRTLCEECCTSAPDGTGLWLYDLHDDEWRSWYDEMSEVEDKMADLTQLKKTVEGLMEED